MYIIGAIRPFIPVVVGIFLGFTLNMMIAPFLDETCDPSEIRNPSQSKNVIKLRETELVGDSKKSETPAVTPKPKRVEYLKPPPRPDSLDGKKFVRPRFASTELGIREKLFVAVLTNSNSINSFAMAVNKTTAQYVTKLMFFTTSKSTSVPPGMQLVSFADKGSQQLPIHVLKYIQEHYPQSYDYYMFITDRTYLRAEKVFELVSHISVGQNVHMGATDLKEDGQQFCSIEGGMVLSQSLLSQTLSSLDWCFSNAHSTNPSLTLGQCVFHATNVPCSEEGGDKEYRHFRLNDFDFDDDIQVLRNDGKFNASMSVYPMPDDLSHYKIHRYYCQLELNLTRQEIDKAKESIINLSHYTPEGKDSLVWPIGSSEETRPKKRFDVIRWNYFTEKYMYFDDDFTNQRPLTGVDKLDIQEILKTAFERANKLYKNRFSQHSLLNGYRRFEPSRGMEYILDLELKDRETKASVFKRFHLLRPLGKPEIVPMPYVTETAKVSLILPLMEEDQEEFPRFMDEFEKSVLENNDNTVLYIMLVYQNRKGKQDIFANAKATLAYYTKKNPGYSSKITWKAMEINASVITEVEILDRICRDFQSTSLLAVVSAGIELEVEYLNRVRMNTIGQWQVFFPIPYWQFKPNLAYEEGNYPSSVELNQKFGHFDINSYEHSSFYVADYLSARKVISVSEAKQMNVFDVFLKNKKLHIFRAAEPSLKHRWKDIKCENVSSQLQGICLERKTECLATRSQLAKLVFSFEEKQKSKSVKSEPDGKEPNVAAFADDDFQNAE